MSKEQPRKKFVLGFTLNQVLFFFLLFIPAMAVVYKIGRSDFITEDELYLNLFTEVLGVIFGVAITVFYIDRKNRQRDKERREQELKERLLREVRSPNNETAIDAVHELRENGWLCGENGLLCGQDLTRNSPTIYSAFAHGARLKHAPLSYANLKGTDLGAADLEAAILAGATLDDADLFYANLQAADLLGASLIQARLTGSNLSRSNLEGAHFGRADLERANLSQAHMMGTSAGLANLRNAKLDDAFLRHASFHGANLENASLVRAKFFEGGSLEGANLTGANLAGAHIAHCTFDMNTILPDRTPWSLDEDLGRFTDPEHSDFWRSSDYFSPAHPRHSQ